MVAILENQLYLIFLTELRVNNFLCETKNLSLPLGEKISWYGIYSQIFAICPDYTEMCRHVSVCKPLHVFYFISCLICKCDDLSVSKSIQSYFCVKFTPNF